MGRESRGRPRGHPGQGPRTTVHFVSATENTWVQGADNRGKTDDLEVGF